MNPPRRPKGYDLTLDDIATIAYAHAALREAAVLRLPCPQCDADAYLTPWHEGHLDWWCLSCNWQGNADHHMKGYHNE